MARSAALVSLIPLVSTFAVPQAIFERSSWPTLAAALDRLPVFTVANGEGLPLQYEVDGKPVAMFYADVEDAKKELELAQRDNPKLDCDLIPVGVGSAFRLQCEGKAVLLPAQADLAAAGAPPSTSAMGQALPLFACMEMSQEADGGGQPKLPLFMAWADCAAAVSQATQADSPDETLEIVGLSLPSVVDRLASMDADDPAFIFIPPTGSKRFIAEYMAADSGAPPMST
eukprot:CAMPEP_0174708096 /NCGR_PEP_ID=MMETSP1094-20130205/10442_1 /TAXON_ID=156173 /ORGANISM="Chrysochromulina brevifilum, Strain UTEX LB 985" /LENGTH=228 /DNA_ID=CAMNT_0015906601 /DNA_START=27 /DNA_END=713 /DNA_ORIENTATION=-